eukprot:300049_1
MDYMDSNEQLLTAKKLIIKYQQDILDLQQTVINLKNSLFETYDKYLVMEQKYHDERNKVQKLETEISRLIQTEHHPSCDDGNDSDEYKPNIDIEYIPMQINTTKRKMTAVKKQKNFYKTRTYENYVKLKLLVKGKVRNCRLQSVSNMYNDLANKKFDVSDELLRYTSPSTANNLMKLKLYDLCIIEIAYCIQNFFGPKSIFDILHDESSDGISFLQAALSFKPDYYMRHGYIGLNKTKNWNLYINFKDETNGKEKQRKNYLQSFILNILKFGKNHWINKLLTNYNHIYIRVVVEPYHFRINIFIQTCFFY